MFEVKQVNSEDAMSLKTVRLSALKDSPFAFGSTYEREAAFPNAEWVKRATERDGTSGVTFLAWDEHQQPCGIAAGFLDVDDPRKAHLVSVWVAPEYRQSGAGRSLLTNVIDWAKSRQIAHLHLMVTSLNQTAIVFYQRLGFAMTGRTEPYPNDSSMVEYEMSLSI